MTDPIYLDHNATTPLLPEVIDAMLPFLTQHFGNPSSAHVYGERARAAIVKARAEVAALLRCTPREIVFTSGGTEANNLAIWGALEAASDDRRHILTSVVEHPATARPCAWLERNGHTVTRVSVDADGRARLDEVSASVSRHTALVTVMHSNNETGAVQPIADIAKRARDAGALMHTDAAQSAGKLPLHVDELGVDLLSIAGHKLYAPKGVGALYVRAGSTIAPFALGAGHEGGLRPGTENVASIVGLGRACEIAARDLTETAARLRALRDRLFERLSSEVPELGLNGHRELRLPNTLNVRFPSVSGDALLAATPEIAASTGSACHEGQSRASETILAMGVAPKAALGSVRLTLGRATTERDVDTAAAALVRAWRTLR